MYTTVFILNLIFCIFIVDFISGLFHWFEDTYLIPTRFQWFNKYVVIPNIEHHQFPYEIWKGSYIETNLVSTILAIFGIAGCVLLNIHDWQPYLILLLLSHSNQIHKWSHSFQPPMIIYLLQTAGIIQGPKHHLIHHKRPYEIRYCIWTNYLNPVLDKIGFWRFAEHLLDDVGLTIKRGSIERNGY